MFSDLYQVLSWLPDISLHNSKIFLQNSNSSKVIISYVKLEVLHEYHCSCICTEYFCNLTALLLCPVRLFYIYLEFVPIFVTSKLLAVEVLPYVSFGYLKILWWILFGPAIINIHRQFVLVHTHKCMLNELLVLKVNIRA